MARFSGSATIVVSDRVYDMEMDPELLRISGGGTEIAHCDLFSPIEVSIGSQNVNIHHNDLHTFGEDFGIRLLGSNQGFVFENNRGTYTPPSE